MAKYTSFIIPLFESLDSQAKALNYNLLVIRVLKYLHTSFSLGNITDMNSVIGPGGRRGLSFSTYEASD